MLTSVPSCLHAAITHSGVARLVAIRLGKNRRVVKACGALSRYELSLCVGAHVNALLDPDSSLDVQRHMQLAIDTPSNTPPLVDQLGRYWMCQILPAHAGEQSCILREIRPRTFMVLGIKQSSQIEADEDGREHDQIKKMLETDNPRRAWLIAHAWNQNSYDERSGYWAVIV